MVMLLAAFTFYFTVLAVAAYIATKLAELDGDL